MAVEDERDAFDDLRDKAFEDVIRHLRVKGYEDEKKVMKGLLGFKRFMKGDVLFSTELVKEGKGDVIYFLVSGTVQLVAEGVFVARLRRVSDMIGEMTPLYVEPRRKLWPLFKIVAEENVTVLAFNSKEIENHGEPFKAFFKEFIAQALFDKLILSTVAKKELLDGLNDVSSIMGYVDLVNHCIEPLYSYSSGDLRCFAEDAMRYLGKVKYKLSQISQYLSENAKAWSRGGE